MNATKPKTQSPGSLHPDCYAPEMPFAHDTGMIYSLRQNGWKKGKPQMENDVWINIQSRTITQKQRDAIAAVIVEALNAAFPVHNDQAERCRTMNAPIANQDATL